MGPGKTWSRKGIWSSSKKPAMTTKAMIADSLNCLRQKNVANPIKSAVMAVASQTFLINHTDRLYTKTDPAINVKSPREKENKMMKEKQQTIAGPRSPSMRKNKMVVI